MSNMKRELRSHRVTGDALTYWLEKTGMKQTDLASAIGVEQGTISNMKRGARGIDGEKLEKIANAFGITIPEFFMKDTGEMPEVVFVDLVKAKPRAGTGGLEVDGKAIKKYSFHRSFVQRKGGTPETMRLFNIDGDSMEPTLKAGDMVMINEQDRQVSHGNIYLLRYDKELMIKRLLKKAGGITIKSDNPKIDPIDVDFSDESLDFYIFGRMVWSCREY